MARRLVGRDPDEAFCFYSGSTLLNGLVSLGPFFSGLAVNRCSCCALLLVVLTAITPLIYASLSDPMQLTTMTS